MSVTQRRYSAATAPLQHVYQNNTWPEGSALDAFDAKAIKKKVHEEVFFQTWNIGEQDRALSFFLSLLIAGWALLVHQID